MSTQPSTFSLPGTAGGWRTAPALLLGEQEKGLLTLWLVGWGKQVEGRCGECELILDHGESCEGAGPLPPWGEEKGADSGSLCLLGSRMGRIWPMLPAKSSRRPQGFGFLLTEEIHAEVCYAECLLQRAALTFLQVGTLSLCKWPGDFGSVTISKPEVAIAATASLPVVQERTEAR